MTGRGEGTFRRLFRLALNTVILMVMLNGLLKAARIYVTHPLGRATKVARTAFELKQVATELATEELLNGSYPEDFTQFMRDNLQRSGGGDPVLDPWGNPYRFQGMEKGFAIASAGPDELIGTADDVYLKRTE